MRHWGVILCETLWLFIILILLALITIGVHAFSPEHVEEQAFGDTKVIINRNLSDGIKYEGGDSNKQVLYYPSNYFTDRVMAFVKNDSDFHRYSGYETSYGTKGYNDMKALLQDAKDNSTLAAVVFTVAEGNKFVKFEIRNRQYDVFKEQFDPYYHVKEIPPDPLLGEFIALQSHVERGIIAYHTGGEHRNDSSALPGIYLRQMPLPCYTAGALVYDFFFSFILLQTFVLPFAFLVSAVVYEKELRLKEFMFVMSVGLVTYFKSWYMGTLALWSIIALALSILIVFLLGGNIFIFLFIVESYVLACISQALFLTTWFDHSGIAGPVAFLIYEINYVIYLVLQEDIKKNPTIIIPLSILPQTAFAYAFDVLSRIESNVPAKTEDIIFDTGRGINLLVIILLLLFVNMVYIVMTLYFDAVFPGEHGISRGWWPCLKWSEKVK